MTFIKKDLVVVSLKTGTSKKGNELQFIKVADTTTFENEQFLLSNQCYIDLKNGHNNFKIGDIVTLEINIENGFTVATVYKQ